MFYYFNAGGIFMWGILFASICGLAIILEKLWMFTTKEKKFEKEYRKHLYTALMKKNREEIVRITEGKKDSVSKIITKIMKSINRKSKSKFNFEILIFENSFLILRFAYRFM